MAKKRKKQETPAESPTGYEGVTLRKLGSVRRELIDELRRVETEFLRRRRKADPLAL